MNNFFLAGARLALATGFLASPAIWASAGNTVSTRPTRVNAAPKPQPAKPDMTFNESNDGQTVPVRVGDVFEVRLESNASTGFEWSVTKQDHETLESDGKSRFVAPSASAPGTPGQQVFRFKVKRAGNSELELQLARPWEKDKTAQKFTLSVSATNREK